MCSSPKIPNPPAPPPPEPPMAPIPVPKPLGSPEAAKPKRQGGLSALRIGNKTGQL